MGGLRFAGGKPDMAAPVSGILASDLAVGSVVKLRENGTPVEYLVVNHGKPSGSSLYDDSCDGLWLLRKDIKENRQWHSSNVNDYANSTIHAWLNGDFFNQFGTIERSTIKQVKVPYRAGSGYGKDISSGVNGLPAKIFFLSATEVAFISDFNPQNEGAILSYFIDCSTSSTNGESKRLAILNGTFASWHLRTPFCYSSQGVTKACGIYGPLGNMGHMVCSDSSGVRPAMILPHTAVFDKNTMLLKGVA